MKNDYFSKWLLFITSYFPLYLWIMFSNIDCSTFHSFKFFVVFHCTLSILIIISILEICSLFRGTGSENKALPASMEISPESDSLMNYVVTYLTPLLSLDPNKLQSVIMNVLLFLLIGLIYVGSSATYLNPILGIFGFRIFGVTGFPHAHHLISKFSFDELETVKKRRDKVIIYRLGDGIYIIKPDKKDLENQ